MRKLNFLLVLTVIFTSQHALANQEMGMMESKSCMTVAHACKNAGYDQGSEHKKFWFDCMKPLIMGHTVKGVNASVDDIKNCRADKIAGMQKELKELQSVQ